MKVASETTIIDSMIFEDHSKLDLSSIHSRSQDDSSHFSDSTDDLSLDNWADDSGLLDETFSSFLPSISKAQPLFDPNHSHLHRNTPDSTLNVSGIKLSCESNLTASVAIKGRSQVKWPLICEIESNYNTQRCNILNFSCNNSFPSPPLPALSQHESFSFKSTSSSPKLPKKLDPHSSPLTSFNKLELDHTLGTLYSAPIPATKECSSNDKVNFDHEDLGINDSISKKSINRTTSFSMTENVFSTPSNLESKTSNLNSKSILMNESSPFKKHNEDEDLQKGTKEDIDYDIDASASALLVNMTNQSPNTYIPREDFSSLTPEVKQIWGKIPPDMKAIILRRRTGNRNEETINRNKDGCKSVKPPSHLRRKFTKAHLHELLNELISETSLSDDNEPEDHVANKDSGSTLLVNSISANAINPGDIRKLMSIPGKNKDIEVKKQAAHELTMSGNTSKSKKKEKSTSVSLVASALVASVLASNAHSHSSLRPKKRFHNAPSVEKIFLPIKKGETFSTSSLFLFQEHPSEKEKFSVKKDAHLFKTSSSFKFLSHLLSCTEEERSSNKISPSKKKTSREKTISIKSIFNRKLGFKSPLIAIKTLPYSPSSSKLSMKPIFNTPSKSVSFKEKLYLHNFKKHDHASCASKALCSHEEIHESTFNQFTKHSSCSHSPARFETSSSSSFETSTEIIPGEHKISSKSSCQDANFMHLISSRFESTRTAFGNLSNSSFEHSINPSSYDPRIEIHHPLFHSSSSEFGNHRKENHLPSNSSPNPKKILGPNKTFDFSSHENSSRKMLEINLSSQLLPSSKTKKTFSGPSSKHRSHHFKDDSL